MERVMFSSEPRAILILGVLLISGCAFKQDEPAKAAVVAAPVAALQTDGMGNRVLVRAGDGSWAAQAPLLLPATPEPELKLQVAFPSALLPSVRRVTAERENQLGVQSISVDWTPTAGGMGLTLSGATTSLPTDKESTAKIRVHFWAEGNQEEALSLELRTPPDAPTLAQTPLTQWKASGKELARGAERLVSSALNLSLLQVVEVSHSSDLTERVTMPVKLAGDITTHVKTIRLTQHHCSYEAPETEADDTLSTGLYLIPLSDDLDQSFVGFLDKHLRKNQMALDIPPGGTTLVGIYGEGERIKSVYVNGFRPSAFASTEVVTSCHPYCGLLSDLFTWNFQGTATNYYRETGFPGGSKDCEHAVCHQNVQDAAYSGDALCSKCLEVDLSSGFQPWDNRRFCRSEAPGSPYSKELWIFNPRKAQIPTGAQNGPLIVSLDSAGRAAKVSFLVDPAEDAPVRGVPEELAAQSVQAPGASP